MYEKVFLETKDAIMKDITPDRIKKWCRLSVDNEKHHMKVHQEPDISDLDEIQAAMKESFQKLKDIEMSADLDESFAQSFIFEWAFFVKALNRMDERKSEAKKRHYIPVSYLANFGISSKNNNNVTLRSLKFDVELGEKKLLLEDATTTASSKFLYGNQDAYMDKHELLFGEFETRVANILRYKKVQDHIVQRNYFSSYPRDIYSEILNQHKMKILHKSLYVRIIVSIFIMLLEYRHFLKEPDNPGIMSEQLDNISLVALTITPMVRKKWFWVHADYTGELSFVNRGVIRFPEQEDAFFFSLSRSWGIFLPSTEFSNKIFSDSKSKFIVDETIPISTAANLVGFQSVLYESIGYTASLGEWTGYKINSILLNNPSERELFYPGADSLAFHPNKNFQPLTKNEILSQVKEEQNDI